MKPLSDPKNDRMIKTVKPPPHRPLTSNLIWDNTKDQSNIKRPSELEDCKRSLKKRRKVA